MADAIVIGGGVMGLAAARELRRRGHSVTLLERGQPGRAASWASAGIVGATLRDEADPHYHLRQVSRALWPSFAEEVQRESGLDPEYRAMGCIQLASDAHELAALQHAARLQPGDAPPSSGSGHPQAGSDPGHAQPSNGPGHPQAGSSPDKVELLDAAELRALEPALSPALLGGLLMPGGNVDNRRLCKALEIAARRAGVQIETGVEVTAIATSGGRVHGVEVNAAAMTHPAAASPATSASDQRARTSEHQPANPERHAANPQRHAANPQREPGSERRAGSGSRRTADLIVLAAGAWSSTIANLNPAPPVAPQRGQILALDQASIGISHVLLTPGDPYFVPRADGRLVIGATREEAGWDPSLTAGGVAWLLTRALEVVPALDSCPIVEMWTGFRPTSADGLPLIGKAAFDGLYFLTGHGPSGIAPLPGSVALLMALIHGDAPPLPPEPFNPLRFEQSGIRR